MAVQKSRKSRSKRGMRRSHDGLDLPTLSIDQRGNLHRRHHIAADGTYRGKQIIAIKAANSVAEEDAAE
ncbi:MAG: 50S ribosomal protein L32 [Gammaproteobacteria bacterium]|nr:50S ribosomal protein L32 [Gammaproteobacteria bacterium]